MTKQTIRVGDSANDRKGDSLRAAFTKVNENFTDLYTVLGLGDGTLNIGSFEFTNSTISTTDSSSIIIDQAVTVSSNLSIGGDLLPQTANGGVLGSSALPWRSLYLSTSTIYLGGVPLSVDTSNNLTINGSTVGGTDTGNITFNGDEISSTGNGVDIQVGDNTWNFAADGSINLPSLNNLGYEPFYDLNGPTLRLGVPTSQTIITGPVPNSDNPSAQRLVIQGQKGYGSENGAWEGGDIYLWGGVGGEGASGGDGGDIKVRGGAGQNGGGGGYVKVEGGDSQISGDGSGGYVEITGGNSYYGGNGNGGNISVRAGTGNGTGAGGLIEFYTNGFNNQWQFNTDATTKFPNDTLKTRPDSRLYIDAHDIGEDYAWVAIRNWNDNTESVNSQVTVRTDGVGISTTGGSVDWSFNNNGTTTFPSNTLKTPSSLSIETPSSTLIPSNWQGQGGWNQGSYTNIATTGGNGTGLTVDVAAGGGGYINIGTITINNPGSGYLAGDVITIDNENNLPGTFTLAAVSNTWDFGTDGRTKIPHGSDNPSTARGASGDKAGMILVSGAYLFYCYADYTDGSVPIWQKVAMDNTDWD